MCKQWKLLSVLLVVLVIHGTVAQVPFEGQCPNITTMKEFDGEAYMGTWFGIKKYPFRPAADRKCNWALYDNLTSVNGNTTFRVTNGGFRLDTNTISNTTGIGRILGPGQIAVVFNSNQNINVGNYIVLGTDYKNYACVYNCKNVNATSYTLDAFILGRFRTMSAEILSTAEHVMAYNKVDLQYLIETDQTDCDCCSPLI